MAYPSPPLLHGYLNGTHTSNLTSFYPPQNLPTPWPLVTASLVLSLALGIKGALLSWSQAGQDRRRGLIPETRHTWLQIFRERRANYRAGIGRPRKEKKRAHPVVHESELEDLHKPDEAHAHHPLNDDSITSYEPESYVDLRNKIGFDEDDVSYKGKGDNDNMSKHKHDIDDNGVAYKGKHLEDDKASKHTTTDIFGDSEAATLHESIREVPESPKWEETPVKKVVMIAICAYSFFRATIGLTIALAGLINHTTPPPAPSLLLVLLISIQIPLSNRSLPRLLTLLYTLSAVLTTLAFLLAAYAPLAITLPNAPKYGQLSISGGTCPVPASDCHSQTTHWSVLGCGNYTYYIDQEDGGGDGDKIPEAQFYPPYATRSDVNLAGNALHVVETVIIVVGTLWLPTVLLHVYEARHLFLSSGPQQQPMLLSNLVRARPPIPQTGRGRRGAAYTSLVAVLAFVGGVVAAVMSLAAHVSQATGTPGHSVTYIDSLGPGTWANFTRDGRGHVVATGYWGNATDWNDCFTVVSPTVGTGWKDWVGQNGGWAVVRIVAGL